MDIDFLRLNSHFFPLSVFVCIFLPKPVFFLKTCLFFFTLLFALPKWIFSFRIFFCVYNIRYEEKIYDDSIPNYTDYDYTLYFLKYRCVLYQLFFLL